MSQYRWKEHGTLINETFEKNKNLKCLRQQLEQKQMYCLHDKEENTVTNRNLYDTRVKEPIEDTEKI